MASSPPAFTAGQAAFVTCVRTKAEEAEAAAKAAAKAKEDAAKAK